MLGIMARQPVVDGVELSLSHLGFLQADKMVVIGSPPSIKHCLPISDEWLYFTTP